MKANLSIFLAIPQLKKNISHPRFLGPPSKTRRLWRYILYANQLITNRRIYRYLIKMGDTCKRLRKLRISFSSKYDNNIPYNIPWKIQIEILKPSKCPCLSWEEITESLIVIYSNTNIHKISAQVYSDFYEEAEGLLYGMQSLDRWRLYNYRFFVIEILNKHFSRNSAFQIMVQDNWKNTFLSKCNFATILAIKLVR